MNSATFLREAFANAPKFKFPEVGAWPTQKDTSHWHVANSLWQGLGYCSSCSVSFTAAKPPGASHGLPLYQPHEGVVSVECGLSKSSGHAVVISWYRAGVLVGRWLKKLKTELELEPESSSMLSAIRKLANASLVPGLCASAGYKLIDGLKEAFANAPKLKFKSISDSQADLLAGTDIDSDASYCKVKLQAHEVTAVAVAGCDCADGKNKWLVHVKVIAHGATLLNYSKSAPALEHAESLGRAALIQLQKLKGVTASNIDTAMRGLLFKLVVGGDFRLKD